MCKYSQFISDYVLFKGREIFYFIHDMLAYLHHQVKELVLMTTIFDRMHVKIPLHLM